MAFGNHEWKGISPALAKPKVNSKRSTIWVVGEKKETLPVSARKSIVTAPPSSQT